MPGLVTALDRNREQIHIGTATTGTGSTCRRWTASSRYKPGPDRLDSYTPTRKHPPAPRRRHDAQEPVQPGDTMTGTETEGRKA